jgi:hypothetical protein
MRATQYIDAEVPIESKAQLLPESRPQTRLSKSVEPSLLPGMLARWKLAKKNGTLALTTLLGDKGVH